MTKMRTPKFFFIEAAAEGQERRTPEVEVNVHLVNDADREIEPDDIRRRDTSFGVVRAMVEVEEFKGGKFSDIITAGPITVSGRVFDALEREGIGDFDAFPAVLDRERSCRLPRGFELPEYWSLVIQDGIVLEDDPPAPPPNERDAHWRWFNRPGRRLVPRDDTWTGYDLVRGRKSIVCTRRIIELARAERWTNFSFRPIDVPPHYRSVDIDYLGAQWPPKQWYLEPYSAGKTAEEWFDLLFDDSIEDHELKQHASLALQMDLPAKAMSLCIDRMRSTTGRDQYRAARMAAGLCVKTDYDPAVMKDEVLPVLIDALRTGKPLDEPEFVGYAIIALKRWIPIDPKLIAEAYKATGKPPLPEA